MSGFQEGLRVASAEQEGKKTPLTLEEIDIQLQALGEPDPWGDEGVENQRAALEKQKQELLKATEAAITEKRAQTQAALAEKERLTLDAAASDADAAAKAEEVLQRLQGTREASHEIGEVSQVLTEGMLTPSLRRYVDTYNAALAKHTELFAQYQTMVAAERQDPAMKGVLSEQRSSLDILKQSNETLNILIQGFEVIPESAQNPKGAKREYFIELPLPRSEETKGDARERGVKEYQTEVHKDSALMLELARRGRAEYVAAVTREDDTNPLAKDQSFLKELSLIEEAQKEDE